MVSPVITKTLQIPIIMGQKIELTHTNNIALEVSKRAMSAYGIKNQNYLGLLFEVSKKAAETENLYMYQEIAATAAADKLAKEIYSIEMSK